MARIGLLEDDECMLLTDNLKRLISFEEALFQYVDVRIREIMFETDDKKLDYETDAQWKSRSIPLPPRALSAGSKQTV